jgi:hypothetical protein
MPDGFPIMALLKIAHTHCASRLSNLPVVFSSSASSTSAVRLPSSAASQLGLILCLRKASSEEVLALLADSYCFLEDDLDVFLRADIQQ